MASHGDAETLVIDGRELTLSNPEKVLFPEAGYTKLDLVRYYLAVADGALSAAGDVPTCLCAIRTASKGEFFYQKRAPAARPDWIETVTLSFPSGREARKKSCRATARRWRGWPISPASNCIRIRFAPTISTIPTNLRVDLDPVPGVEWPQIRDVARWSTARSTDFGLIGWPKTSGSRGMHIYVRIERRWTFDQVRRARSRWRVKSSGERPPLATSKWWKEERHGVFLDYNQNAKDRTVAAAYSVRPTPDARVSAPLAWDEIADCVPADFTLATMPAALRASWAHRHAGMDRAALLARGAARAVGAAGEGRAWATRRGRRTTGSRPGEAAAPSRAVAAARGQFIHSLEDRPGPRKKTDALAGLERWKARHPEAAAHLAAGRCPDRRMRGRSRTWTRVRVNLQHVPEALRPPQEPLDPDEDMTETGRARSP